VEFTTPKRFRAAISSNPTRQTLPMFVFVLMAKKIFFPFKSLVEKRPKGKKPNGGFTLYAVPFQESLIFSPSRFRV